MRMPVNRALKAARVPCALFAALEAKRHHPQLAQRCILLLRFYCGLHELSTKQQEVDTSA
jgi:hypothetical protein